ncbi:MULTISPECIES: hypothetical protein [Bacillaceae]|uniref:Uncharacterized protein n=1 Tax=Domibacillus aminovorans TaxID=29332 RepID=A0A177L217_9BACI|nr:MULTISPECIES: hypothetical protein [Bacillaceae]OAH59613.1 hypothetical protein AWH48_00465 [Domibacillus aminovorans]
MVQTEMYHTNDTVKETGKYICTSEAVKELQKGDAFPHCPKTNELTTWRHVDHEQKTRESDPYIDENDIEADLKSGLTFPTPNKSVDDLGDEVNVESGLRFPTPQKSGKSID